MARPRYPKHDAPLPPPLPPETRTVGQLVAESLRFYGSRFFTCLLLGALPALTLVGLAGMSESVRLVGTVVFGGLAFTGSFIAATLLVTRAAPDAGAILLGLLLGLFVFAPVPLLAWFLVLPAVLWLAAFGLAVPAVVVERRGPVAALGRGWQLARADFVHAAGSIATLVLLFLLTTFMLFLLLRGQGDAALQVAAFASVLLVSPVLFLGSAFLYVDQEARHAARGGGGR